MSKFSKFSLKELRNIVRNYREHHNIRGFSTMKREQLVSELDKRFHLDDKDQLFLKTDQAPQTKALQTPQKAVETPAKSPETPAWVYSPSYYTDDKTPAKPPKSPETPAWVYSPSYYADDIYPGSRNVSPGINPLKTPATKRRSSVSSGDFMTPAPRRRSSVSSGDFVTPPSFNLPPESGSKRKRSPVEPRSSAKKIKTPSSRDLDHQHSIKHRMRLAKIHKALAGVHDANPRLGFDISAKRGTKPLPSIAELKADNFENSMARMDKATINQIMKSYKVSESVAHEMRNAKSLKQLNQIIKRNKK